jgi:hypothetical protein
LEPILTRFDETFLVRLFSTQCLKNSCFENLVETSQNWFQTGKEHDETNQHSQEPLLWLTSG